MIQPEALTGNEMYEITYNSGIADFSYISDCQNSGIVTGNEDIESVCGMVGTGGKHDYALLMIKIENTIHEDALD